MRSFALVLIAAVASAQNYEYEHPEEYERHGKWEDEHYEPVHEHKYSSSYHTEYDPIPAEHELRRPVSHADFREAVGSGSYQGALVTDTKHSPSFRSLGRHYEGHGAGPYGVYGYAHTGMYGDHGYTYGGHHPGEHVTSEHRYMGVDGDTGELVERVDQRKVAYVPGEHWQVSHHLEPHYEHSQIHFDTHHDTHTAPEHSWDEPLVATEEMGAPTHARQTVPTTAAERKHEGLYSAGPVDAWTGAPRAGVGGVYHAPGYAGHGGLIDPWTTPAHHAVVEHVGVEHSVSDVDGKTVHTVEPVVHGGVVHDYAYAGHGPAYGYGSHVRPSYHAAAAYDHYGYHHDDEWAPHSYRVHDTKHYEPYDGYTHYDYSTDHRAPRHRASDHPTTHYYEDYHYRGERTHDHHYD